MLKQKQLKTGRKTPQRAHEFCKLRAQRAWSFNPNKEQKGDRTK